ncbi:hypothetical protein Tco_1502975 [Tanacetum coccineum]
MKISRSVGLKVLCGGRLRSELYRMETGFIVLVSISVYDWLKGMGDDYGVNVCFGSVSYGGVRLLGFGVGIEEDDDPDDITGIFKIEGNLFDFETPLCEAFNDFNYLLKIDKDLFTFDIQGTGTYKEYELNNPTTRDLEEPWCGYTLPHPGVPYQLWESYLGWFRHYDSSNAGNTQDNQVNEECRDDPTHEPSVCKIRRFEMMKYSLNADEEYIAIKESEYLNHSKNNLDAYRELLHIINEEWVMTTPDDE